MRTQPAEIGPMNAQDEIARLKREIERLQNALNQMSPVANLPSSLIDNLEFITDLARYAEGLLSEAAVRKKYHFSEEAWERLGQNNALIEAIEAEKVRRIRSGTAKREKAQQHVVRGPDVLATIMDDPKANARHRVDSIKALDALADNGPQSSLEQDRVVIRIDLTAGGGEVLEFKAGKPTPGNDAKLIDHNSNTPGVPGFKLT